MSEVSFVVETNVALPPRTIPNAGPRESKYPVDQLQEGQAFAIPLGEYDGDTFKPFAAGSDEAEKQARQKQSQMSGLAKSRGIKLTTRYFSGAEDSQSPFASTPAPCLGVWHAGKADPNKKRKSKAKDEEQQADTEANTQAPAAPAAPSAPADDVVTL